jgi:hypothetical protein
MAGLSFDVDPLFTTWGGGEHGGVARSMRGECIEWTPTYLYLTMIELLVPLKG